MSDRQLQLMPDEVDVATKDTSYLLEQLEVYNWGPFRGLHRATFDPNGTAIIGPTGSGKTTLVDALMTLLVVQPRYNLASTGGHESDRTLISYVRGVLGGDGSDGREEVARPGKTITAVCATYRGGEQTVRLAGLLWTDGASNAADDLKRRWLFSLADDQSLEQWLHLLHDDGIRDLMRTGRETAGLRIFEGKRAYIAHIRKFFDVGENAFTLLNRAAGLKQLNSIDEIFRELVLDDRSKFARALEVAAEFNNLEAIHAELVTAQRQQESLVPVADEHQRLLNAFKKVDRFRVLKRIVPVWFAIVGRDKWSEVIAQLSMNREGLETELTKEREKARASEARVDTLRQRYLELGGDVIGELEKTIAVQRERVKEKSKHAVHYRALLKPFRLGDELSAETLRHNQAWLGDHREEAQKLHDRQHEATLAALSRQRELETSVRDTQATLRKVQDRPESNIPPPFQDFRAELAMELSLREGDLPFLAELVEVRPDESAWRGAIERAIGSERLRVLVPDDRIDSALQWVNDRNNRLHVRLQRAERGKSSAAFFADGYLRKLNFKAHPLAEAARTLLASRDLHCVASPSALKTTEHALTMQGMMSGRHGKFEKQDQRRLDHDWMTGFNNKDQLESLAGQLEAAQKALEQSNAESQKHRKELARLAERLTIIDEIARLEFSEIDLPGAEAELAQSEERIAALLDPNSDASQAKALYEAENRVLESMREDIGRRQNEIAVLESQHDHAEQERDKAHERIGAGLSDGEMSLGKAHLAISPNVAAQRLDVEERRLTTDVESKLNKQLETVMTIELELVRLMGKARQVDTGALAETGSEIQDIPAYLERLRVLNEEALPEKRGRFLDYLNRSSDQGVTQLLAGINEEVDVIEQRIHDLNQTLVKVDFRSGRYLQLQPQRIKDERLRALDAAIRKVRAAALKDDGGESHYKALQEMVGILRQAAENPRQQGSRALLDPRFRLQFFVVEVDRRTGDRSPPRSGSQSGSGGEKELMASHILTASLSYALCPQEANCPLYGTVVLDEAFSKSSPSAAARIIEALRIFRLHAIFVTPNKEIGLLKQHTQKVVCVQRPGKEASLASISWEKLEESCASKMKSPAELRVVLRRQWEDATRREARLLGAQGAWPVAMSIGRPSARRVSADLDAVKRHVSAWRQMRIGKVMWKAVRYRATADAVEIPTQWRLYKPSEWLDACADAAMRQEFETLATLVGQTDSLFHSLLVRKRSLWRGKPEAEVAQAARLAMALSPNCAVGRPLRMVSIEGIDTKFFERNAQLVTALLDVRFDGEVNKIGLESFLGAFAEGDHWVLLLDLDGSLLPFKQLRVRSSDLRATELPGERLLIIENESCQHQVPAVAQTVAVLGAGFDLGWTDADWLSKKKVAYWGDIDTWGLQCLARARKAIRHLCPLLMSSEIFAQFGDLAVPEPVVAGAELPVDLTSAEKCLYKQLLREPRGRLEQEFLPEVLCRATILNWMLNS